MLVAVRAHKVREAVVAMIAALEGFQVVAEAASGQQAVAAARSLHPTLAVVDQDLAGCSGAWTVQTLREEQLVGAIVAIGLRGDEGVRRRALVAGARSYVQTGAPPEDVMAALRDALGGAPGRITPATRAPAVASYRPN